MVSPKPVQRIAIVGTGTIGASWATHYLAEGFDVMARTLRRAPRRTAVRRRWRMARSIEAGTCSPRLLRSPEVHLRHGGGSRRRRFRSENAPERPELKVKLFAEIDDATPPDAIIASSSSGITMSVMQAKCRRPERTVIGHPFNPPHVIPLVEVVGGASTSPETVSAAMDFYRSIGKKPILLKKELPGHAPTASSRRCIGKWFT